MKCPLKFARYEFEGGEDCVGAECGFYGAVCRNDDSEPKSDVSAADVDANDTSEALDSREKINALRAYYGAGPTAMTDEQIEAGREVYGAKRDADMVIVDELTNAINELQKKQPYCYNPEVPLDTLRTVGRYIDELQAAYDELTEIAAQLCRACGFSMVDAAGEVVS